MAPIESSKVALDGLGMGDLLVEPADCGTRETAEPFAEDEAVGETKDMEEEVEAFDKLRRRFILFTRKEFAEYVVLTCIQASDDGPGRKCAEVSILR